MLESTNHMTPQGLKEIHTIFTLPATYIAEHVCRCIGLCISLCLRFFTLRCESWWIVFSSLLLVKLAHMQDGHTHLDALECVPFVYHMVKASDLGHTVDTKVLHDPKYLIASELSDSSMPRPCRIVNFDRIALQYAINTS